MSWGIGDRVGVAVSAGTIATFNSRRPGPVPSLVLDFAGTGTLDSRVTFTRSTTGTYYNSSGVLSTAAINAPRFDYNPSTLAPLGLLIEQSSTNLLLQSQTFDNVYWSKSGVTITADATTAPDGTQTGDALIESISLSTHQIYRVSVGTANTYTFTLYAQSKGRTQIQIEQESGGNSRFTLTGNGTALALGANTVSITNVGNGWYRCSTTFTTTVAFGVYIGLYNGGLNYLGDGTSGCYIWGAQLEALAFPTSYIPTTSAQVTRASDTASMTGTNFSSWYNASQGTLYEEITLNSNVAFPRMPNFYNSATPNTNNIDIFYGSGANYLSAGTRTNSVITPTSNILVSFTPPATAKMAFSFATNQGYFGVNGVTPTSISLLTIPTVDTFSLTGGANSYYYTGGSIYIKKISYYPQALTSSQIQALTT